MVRHCCLRTREHGRLLVCVKEVEQFRRSSHFPEVTASTPILAVISECFFHGGESSRQCPATEINSQDDSPGSCNSLPVAF